MRYVVVGIGAIGGSVAARLHLAGLPVVGVGRGEHLHKVRRDGLLLRHPSGDVLVGLDARSVSEVDLRAEDVVVLATKSQDTTSVLASWGAIDNPVVCAQNGIANESQALRWSPAVYGMSVMSPCVHLEPGCVAQYGVPVHGIMDVGRYPHGVDQVAESLAADLTRAGYTSRAVPDVAAWKAHKLLTNLGNAVEAVCGPASRGGELTRLMEREARSVLEAHAIECPTDEAAAARYDGLMTRGLVGGAERPGGSLWQSSVRGLPTEVDYLNGEIVRLARLVDMKAPANELVQRCVHDIGSGRCAPEALTEEDLLARVRH